MDEKISNLLDAIADLNPKDAYAKIRSLLGENECVTLSFTSDFVYISIPGYLITNTRGTWRASEFSKKDFEDPVNTILRRNGLPMVRHE